MKKRYLVFFSELIFTDASSVDLDVWGENDKEDREKIRKEGRMKE